MTAAKPRILCLDDRPESLHVRKILLEQFGCVVEIVTDPRKCLRMATDQRFDLALLDYHIGHGFTGEDVARDLHACLPELPLIMLTGDPGIPDSARDSVDVVLIKGSSNPSDLLRTIQSLLPDFEFRMQVRIPRTQPQTAQGKLTGRKPNGTERPPEISPAAGNGHTA